MYLSDLNTGQSAIIIKVLGHGGFRRRIMEMGFVRGKKVTVVLNAPLKDPIKYQIMDYEVSLRRSEAAMIEVLTEEETRIQSDECRASDEASGLDPQDILTAKIKEINIALVGNPNSGKTSLFNVLSGGHEHVGNYGGVTVDAKSGHFRYGEYKFNITDLPGTYALSAYTPEELYVRRHLLEKSPDIIINTVVASNLERNLYLTTELIDINPRMVVALNMYDELTESGAVLDYGHLGKMLGIPMIPIVARSGKGTDKLLDTVIDVYENRNPVARHIHITHSPVIENELSALSRIMKEEGADLPRNFPPRYWAMKLLEGDTEIEHLTAKIHPDRYPEWKGIRDAAAARIKKQLGEDPETAMTNEKYGFISGALKETFTPSEKEQNKNTAIIDSIVTHKLFSFPIFLFLIWVMFNATFSLGAYPQEWIESLVGLIGSLTERAMSDGPLKDLLVNGIIGGVGSVIVFLPNILILYLFISLMEDSGYMARAAFIMDKIMHKIGLHGKSFIPLIMGFGCNVPAIISSRAIESRTSRLITILINPFMSCSARLPVYILMAGTFFPHNSGLALMLLYLLGIVVAIFTAKMMRRFLFKTDDTPFVMELPPYRVPTLNATLRHMWDKGAQYLRKIGTVILLASIVIWFLSYYPHSAPNETASPEISGFAAGADVSANIPQKPDTYLEQIGKFCEPVMKPLGLNWKAGVALLSGSAAKEIIVSTLGVLSFREETEMNAQAASYKNALPDYTPVAPDEFSSGSSEGRQDDSALSERLLRSGDFTDCSAAAFMVFVLLYFPCIAALAAIAHEAGSWKWAAFSMIYSTTVAWIAAFIIYNICKIF